MLWSWHHGVRAFLHGRGRGQMVGSRGGGSRLAESPADCRGSGQGLGSRGSCILPVVWPWPGSAHGAFESGPSTDRDQALPATPLRPRPPREGAEHRPETPHLSVVLLGAALFPMEFCSCLGEPSSTSSSSSSPSLQAGVAVELCRSKSTSGDPLARGGSFPSTLGTCQSGPHPSRTVALSVGA